MSSEVNITNCYLLPSGDVSRCQRYEAGQLGRETAGLLQGYLEVLH